MLCFVMLSFRVQNLNTDALVVEHIMVNRAPRTRRRTYRAHGRINRKYIPNGVLWMWGGVRCVLVGGPATSWAVNINNVHCIAVVQFIVSVHRSVVECGVGHSRALVCQAMYDTTLYMAAC